VQDRRRYKEEIERQAKFVHSHHTCEDEPEVIPKRNK